MTDNGETPTTPTDASEAAPPPAVAAAAAPDAVNPEPTAPEIDWTDPEARQQYLTQREGEIVATVREQTRAEREAAERDQRAREEQQAALQSDMDWATELDKRLDSNDPDVRAAARAERDEARDRYNRGMALQYQHADGARWNKHYTERITGQYREIAQQYPELTQQLEADQEAFKAGLEAKGGNYLLFFMEQGKQLGEAAGYARGVEETERRLRVDANAEGPHSQSNVNSPGGNSNPFAGIDKSKPGAGIAMMRAADAR